MQKNSEQKQAQKLVVVILTLSELALILEILFNFTSTSLSTFYLKMALLAFITYKLLENMKLSLTRKVSQITSLLTKIRIPKIFRNFIFTLYSNHYNVVTSDMIKPFESYKNFNEFFTRPIKPRFINPDPKMAICPTDSKILSITQIHSNETLLVKNIKYNLGHFLTGDSNYKINNDDLNDCYRMYPNSTVWSCILYLAPGDYHRYHCPVDFLAQTRKHILGKLAPVKVSYVSSKTGVYEGNERVVLQGEWDHGFMFITFVGATNVGSMTVNFDSVRTIYFQFSQQLSTNKPFTYHRYFSIEKDYKNMKVDHPYEGREKGVYIPKGSEIGKFNFGISISIFDLYEGSTVVLVFESCKKVNWKVSPGDNVRYGQPLFTI